MQSEQPRETSTPDGATALTDGGTAVTTVDADEADEGVVRELGHDQFDPVGTLTLILLYLAVLVVMWFFMYFVEFLGNGPTVVG